MNVSNTTESDPSCRMIKMADAKMWNIFAKKKKSKVWEKSKLTEFVRVLRLDCITLIAKPNERCFQAPKKEWYRKGLKNRYTYILLIGTEWFLLTVTQKRQFLYFLNKKGYQFYKIITRYKYLIYSLILYRWCDWEIVIVLTIEIQIIQNEYYLLNIHLISDILSFSGLHLFKK